MGEIVMPRLSDTMEEGTILRWLKSDGDQIERGSELVEIETDKAAMTYESDQEGVLEIVAPEGSTLAIGEVIARIGAGASSSAEPSANGQRAAEATAQPATAATPPQPATAGPRQPAQTAPPQPAQTTPPQPAQAAPPQPAQAAPPRPVQVAPGAAPHDRIRASPLARRLAQERGVDLQTLSGSGPGGRIVKADVEGAATASGPVSASEGARPSATAIPTPTPAPTAPAAPDGRQPMAPASTGDAATGQAAVLEGVATAKGETTVVELNRTQATIARRMAESKATIPDFSLQIDVDMEACVALRSELKRLAPASSDGEQPAVPTYNDMIVKAAALALREHPRANGSYRDALVQLHSRVNVGIAVAAHDALVVPTVFDADEKSLGEIAREARALAARVREGTITPPELGGGTFTVSNLGMYGIRSFTAIINPPQAAILSVGELKPRAVADGEQLRARSMLTLTLACDHRILYGADAAVFLARIRELLQAPTSLTL